MWRRYKKRNSKTSSLVDSFIPPLKTNQDITTNMNKDFKNLLQEAIKQMIIVTAIMTELMTKLSQHTIP